jgi:hypothetical protein
MLAFAAVLIICCLVLKSASLVGIVFPCDCFFTVSIPVIYNDVNPGIQIGEPSTRVYGRHTRVYTDILKYMDDWFGRRVYAFEAGVWRVPGNADAIADRNRKA